MIVFLSSKEEKEGYKKAGLIACRILDKLIDSISINKTGMDLDNIAREECKNLNANPVFLNYNGYPATVCISINNVLVHGIPTNEKFKFDDIISIDFGVEIDGFIGDVAKTVILQENFLDSWMWNLQPSINRSCQTALFAAINKARSGNKLNEIGKTIEIIAKENNFKVPKEYGGHGISKNKLHAQPFISNFYDEREDLILRPGMILAIEPMFIDAESDKLKIGDDKWSVIASGLTSHFEHTILVTEGQPIILTEGII